jgi:hypothetical protein
LSIYKDEEGLTIARYLVPNGSQLHRWQMTLDVQSGLIKSQERIEVGSNQTKFVS